jgi:hypothetical protein
MRTKLPTHFLGSINKNRVIVKVILQHYFIVHLSPRVHGSTNTLFHTRPK